MDIRSALENEHSKALTLKIVDWVGHDPDRFAELMELYLHDEMRINQRASWAVGHIGEHAPDLIEPWLPKMIEKLSSPQHDAVVRNTVRIWQFIDIPEEYLGQVAELCFQYLGGAHYPIAFRAFSMTVLYNICLREPGLMNELKLMIEDLIPYGSSGLKSRGRKILNAIEKYQEEHS